MSNVVQMLNGSRDVTTPRGSRPLPPANVAGGEWDAHFQHLTARLAQLTQDPEAHGMRVDMADCLAAMRHLQEQLGAERSRNWQTELQLCDARTALAQSQAELVGSRSNERHSRRLSLHDDLTSLPNRCFFNQRLKQTLLECAAVQQSFAVLYLDLDGFKAVNDTHGHAVGDELLRVVASRLARAVRADDTASRLGGDEFACLLNNLPRREELSRVACKLFDVIAAPVKIGPHELTMHASIGIARCPTDGDTAEALLGNADAAMYEAKRKRSGYAFFDQHSHTD